MNIFFNVNTNSLLAIRAVIFMVTACYFNAYSQQVDSDTEYFSQLDDYSHVAFNLTNRHNSFLLKPGNNKDDFSKYVSSSNRVFGIGFHLFNIGFGLSMPLGKETGNIKNVDFRSNITDRRWGLDFILQKYKGYKSTVPREDVSYSNLTINGYYIVNFRKYSLPATANFLEIQNRNAGSLLGHVVFSRARIGADSSLFTTNTSMSDTISQLNGSRFFYAGVLPGYGYTFVKNSFFTNVSLSFGPVHVWEKYSFASLTTTDFSFEWLTIVQAVLGYNSKRFFYGISTQLSRLEVDYQALSINTSSWQIKMFLGIRFQEKGLFRRSISDIYKRKS